MKQGGKNYQYLKMVSILHTTDIKHDHESGSIDPLLGVQDDWSEQGLLDRKDGNFSISMSLKKS